MRRIPRIALMVPLALAYSTTVAFGQEFVETSRMLPWDAHSAEAVAVADVDGDGDLDVFLGDSGPNLLYLNDGTATFTDASDRLPAHSDFTTDAVFADADGDQDLDLFLARGLPNGATQGPPNRLYFNDGQGFFTDAGSAYPVDIQSCNGLDVGDVDGDGDADVLLAAAGQRCLLFRNNGGGSFTDVSTTQLPLEPDRSVAVSLGDVDGDGDLDAVVGNLPDGVGTGDDQLYLNNGNGVFSVAAAALPTSTATLDVELADMDADLDLDIVVGTGSFEADRLYLNDGSGVFTDGTAGLPVLPVAGGATRVIAQDVDGDGERDLYFCRGGIDSLFVNAGGGQFTDASASLPIVQSGGVYVGARDAGIADLDGNGRADILMGVALAYPAQLILQDENGALHAVTDQLPPWPGGMVAVGDVTGDGLPDILMGASLTRHDNDGRGQFSAAVTAGQGAATFNTLQDVQLADLDGDGDRDLIQGTSGQNRLYLNDGAGNFTEVVNALPRVSNTVQVAVVDVDQDGDLDLVTANATGGTRQDRLFLNQGGGVFTDVTLLLPAGSGSSTGVVARDFDGDGKVDLFFASHNAAPFQPLLPGPDRLYLRSGSSFIDASASLPEIVDVTLAVASGDLDGDGDNDLLLGNATLGAMYRNIGAGIFSDVPGAVPAAFTSVSELELVDVDEDGDLDAWAVVGNGRDNFIFVNDGLGNFTDATAVHLPVAGHRTSSVASIDLDQDGDRDFVVSTAADQRILFSTRRHVFWRGLPRIGVPLKLELRGDPLAPWLLLASFNQASIPVGNRGVLQLGPPIIPILVSTFDSSGASLITGNVPDDPQFVGIPVYWQVYSGSPPRYSNLEVTTFQDF